LKVKIFHNSSIESLERNINGWLHNFPIYKIHFIKQNLELDSDGAYKGQTISGELIISIFYE